MQHEIRQNQSRLSTEVTQLTEDVYYSPSPIEKEIEVGVFVKMRAGSATGKVQEINKKDAIVQMGEMRVKVKLKDLVAVGTPLDIRSTPSVVMDNVTKSATFDPKVDLRGMTMFDAEKALQDFMDNAVLSSATSLRIVHGKGDGILRKVVKKKLKEYKEVKKHFHPEHFEGGDGVTVVEF